uniref:Nop domain-containing protein n=1 Tax=Rhizophora mucronata TaxID=61149 RepID=A0A2P2NW48_RHIMU
MGTAGELTTLAKLPADHVQLLGMKRMNVVGFSVFSEVCVG